MKSESYQFNFTLSPSVLPPAATRASSCLTTIATLMADWRSASPGSWPHLTSLSWLRRTDRRPSVSSTKTVSVKPPSSNSLSATLLLLELSQLTRRRRRRMVSSQIFPHLLQLLPPGHRSPGGAPRPESTPTGSLVAVLCFPAVGLSMPSETTNPQYFIGLPVGKTSGQKINLFPS